MASKTSPSGLRLRPHTDVQTQLNPVVAVRERELGDGAERSTPSGMLLVRVDGDAHVRCDRVLCFRVTQSRGYGGSDVGEPGHSRKRKRVLLDMMDQWLFAAAGAHGWCLRGRGKPDIVEYVAFAPLLRRQGRSDA